MTTPKQTPVSSGELKHECGHFVAGVNQRGRACCCLCGMEYDCDTKKFHKYDPDKDWKN